MRRWIGLAIVIVAGCSSEAPAQERSSVPDPGDAAADGATPAIAEGGVIDPNGGRDDLPSSCFAACQSAGFGCQAKTDGGTILTEARLAANDVGCAGTLAKGGGEAPAALELHCAKAEVCVGGLAGTTPTACVPATFSALGFRYTPTGESPNVCTRRD